MYRIFGNGSWRLGIGKWEMCIGEWRMENWNKKMDNSKKEDISQCFESRENVGYKIYLLVESNNITISECSG